MEDRSKGLDPLLQNVTKALPLIRPRMRRLRLKALAAPDERFKRTKTYQLSD
jgi:hypothetical protein